MGEVSWGFQDEKLVEKVDGLFAEDHGRLGKQVVEIIVEFIYDVQGLLQPARCDEESNQINDDCVKDVFEEEVDVSIVPLKYLVDFQKVFAF